eukprot:8212798-Pyramimonas_sp.AAC.1
MQSPVGYLLASSLTNTSVDDLKYNMYIVGHRIAFDFLLDFARGTGEWHNCVAYFPPSPAPAA